ncbi:phosphatidylinositol-specific phospholipase C [Streptomyces olivoreticuli]
MNGTSDQPERDATLMPADPTVRLSGEGPGLEPPRVDERAIDPENGEAGTRDAAEARFSLFLAEEVRTAGEPAATTSPGPLPGPFPAPLGESQSTPVAAPLAELGAWMRDVPGNVSLRDLSIPGTHDSAAYRGMNALGYVHCQAQNLAWQLNHGVRFLDIRLKRIDVNVLACYHGSFYLEQMFGDVYQTCRDFLALHPSEAILMRISCEGDASAHAAFMETFRWYLDKYWGSHGFRGGFHISNSIPTLGVVRGKIVLTSRDPYLEEAGGAKMGLNHGSFDVQDVSQSISPSAKLQKVRDHLAKAANSASPKSSMFANYTGANGAPLGTTPWGYAGQVNPGTLTTLNGIAAGKTVGVMAMDYIDRPAGNTNGGRADLMDAIIRLNPQPSNDVALLIGNGSTWNGPSLPWPGAKTNDAPALAMHDGKLYCAVRGLGNQVFVSRRETNGQWTGFGQVPGASTLLAPALASYNNQLHLTYRVSSNDMTNNSWVVVSSTRGDNWSAPGPVNVTYTGGGAALAAHLGRLWHAVVGKSNTVLVGSSNGSSWWLSTDTKIHWTTVAPALAVFKNKLYMAYRGPHDGVYVTVRDDSIGASPWPAPVQLPGTTPSSPALAVRGNTLYCAVRGGDDRIYVSGNAGSGWGAFSPITAAGTETRSGPALAALNANDLYLTYRAVL